MARFQVHLCPRVFPKRPVASVLKHFPEAQSLVGGSCADRRAVGGKRHMQHSLGMAEELGLLVAVELVDVGLVDSPQAELVFGVAVRTHDLPLLGVADDGADLGLGVDDIDGLAGFDVPHPHCFIRGSSARYQKISLPRAPGQSFDSPFMSMEVVSGLLHVQVPHNCQVVIAARSQPTCVMLQSANLPPVP